MKNIILSSLLFFTLSTLAKGHHCEALCIVVDSAESTLHFIGLVEIEAGTDQVSAHKLLKKLCTQNANDIGFDYGVALVDELKFKSYYQKETENTSQSQTNSNTHVNATAAANTRWVYASVSIDNYQSSTIFNHNYFKITKELDLKVIYSKPKIACKLDESIQDGNIPYIGHLNPL